MPEKIPAGQRETTSLLKRIRANRAVAGFAAKARRAAAIGGGMAYVAGAPVYKFLGGAVGKEARPLSLCRVLLEEAKALRPDAGIDPELAGICAPARPFDGAPDTPKEKTALARTYEILHRQTLTALCLSGGGIRSAAFSLGVIQCLAGLRAPRRAHVPERFGESESLLQQFDYLSTVSGGGYIGSWLSAWLYHERLRAKGAGRASQVIAALMDRSAANEEDAPIAHLRENSNFLTPKLGLFSADAWAAIANYMRNLVLNWTIFLPVLILLVIAVKGYARAVLDAPKPDSVVEGLGIVALALFLAALSARSAARRARDLVTLSSRDFVLFDWLPIVLAASLATVIAFHPPLQASLLEESDGFIARLGGFAAGLGYWARLRVVACVAGAALYLGGWFLAPLWPFGWPYPPDRPDPELTAAKVDGALVWAFRNALRDLAATLVCGALFGFFVVEGVELYVLWSPDLAANALGLVVLGVPWFVSAQIVAEDVFLGLRSAAPFGDSDREWFARAHGWYSVAGIGWFLVFILVFLEPIVPPAWRTAGWWSLTLSALVSGTGVGALAKSSLAPLKALLTRPGFKAKAVDWGLMIGAAVFGAAMVALVSIVLDFALAGGPYPVWPGLGDYCEHGKNCGRAFAIAFAVSLAIALVSSRLVNINRFSLHGFYRNRLVRTFLAASRRKRPGRDLFTDYDPSDNPHFSSLWPKEAPVGDDWRPLHVINLTLNLVAAKKLAWQERMAEAFTVTPLHSGSASLNDGSGAEFQAGAYQRSINYAGRYGGISLGTAMAASGAAVSPSMGYHSSPALSFLMALLNVRLGVWLPNPGSPARAFHDRDGPLWALLPLLEELFGQTTDARRYVYLSDGGHFENLGIYEMVRRRCRLIVAVDAGCDPDCKFQDLGDAIRKISLDLRVRIDMSGLERIKPGANGNAGAYAALGLIRYADADGAGAADGLLIYMKPAIRGSEPADILSYRASHEAFPHDTTGDQWFSESQFESYRALGEHIAAHVLAQFGDRIPVPNLLGAAKFDAEGFKKAWFGTGR